MGIFEGIGKTLNDITGATSAAQVNNKYQKEFAQNAHQWEVKDLEAAGLNPILSAGGSGASASGGGTTPSGTDPVSLIAGVTNAMQNMANAKNTDADTIMKKALTQGAIIENAIKSGASEETIKNLKAQYQKTLQEINLISGQTTQSEATTAKTKAEQSKIVEETKRTKGGIIARQLGTGTSEPFGEAMQGLTNWYGDKTYKLDKWLDQYRPERWKKHGK